MNYLSNIQDDCIVQPNDAGNLIINIRGNVDIFLIIYQLLHVSDLLYQHVHPKLIIGNYTYMRWREKQFLISFFALGYQIFPQILTKHTMSDMATTISIQDRLYQAYEVIISGFVVLKIRHGLIKTNSIFLSLVAPQFTILFLYIYI